VDTKRQVVVHAILLGEHDPFARQPTVVRSLQISIVNYAVAEIGNPLWIDGLPAGEFLDEAIYALGLFPVQPQITGDELRLGVVLMPEPV
jgi:hypothetical protein